MGRNVHGSCLEITEPEMDDEVTGEKDAYMAGVLARYRKTLVEKTKYHLGAPNNRRPFSNKFRSSTFYYIQQEDGCITYVLNTEFV